MPPTNHPENAILATTDPATTNNSPTTGTLSELNTTLAELQPLASNITDLQKQTLEKEAIILKAILEKLTPLVPLLSEDYGQLGEDHELLGKVHEQCYRREIVILTNEERVQLENFSIFSEHRLILYENGLLVGTHRYGQSMNCCQSIDNGQSADPALSTDHIQSIKASYLVWENTDEDVLTPEAAILAFGFTAISKGLMKALGEVSSMAILKEELEGRIAALTNALETLL